MCVVEGAERLNLTCFFWTNFNLCRVNNKNMYMWCSSNFWVCGRNPMVWPFKWNLFSSTFEWFHLFFNILQNKIWDFSWILIFDTLGSFKACWDASVNAVKDIRTCLLDLADWSCKGRLVSPYQKSHPVEKKSQISPLRWLSSQYRARVLKTYLSVLFGCFFVLNGAVHLRATIYLPGFFNF